MRNKKLIRKGKIGMMVDPSQALHNAAQSGMKQIAPMQNALGGQGGLGALLGGQGGFGKQMLGSMGGVQGIAGMAGTLGAAALNKDNDLIRPEAQAVQEGLYSLLGTAGPKGQLAASALKLMDAGSNKLTLKEAGVDRFGRKIASKQGAITPTDIAGNAVANIKDVIKGDTDLKEFGARMARLTPAGFFLGATAGQRQAAREGETYRNLQQQTTQELKQNRIEAQQRSQKLREDTRTAAWGTMSAKKGGKLPEPCGCDKEGDGLDTDVFYAMPKQLFGKVMKRVNLPEKTPYNDRIKSLIKNSVPKGSNLRSFIESIGDDVKQFIERWENGRNKV